MRERASGLRGLLVPLDEKLNPILVKEVRQSLRGRFFMVLFWLTLTAATIAGSVMLVVQATDPDDLAGQTFFIVMYACLSFALHLFVPFAAFLSVGNEWDENTFDLLVLSNLRPRQIVLGKILSSGIQVLLYFSAFGPFLVFAFLLRGLDLQAAFVVLGLTLASSMMLSTLAIALSSLSRIKFVRVFLMALLAVLLAQAAFSAIPLVYAIFDQNVISSPEALQAMGVAFCAFCCAAALGGAFAATRFAHPEENRSTGLRVLTTVIVFVGVAWMCYVYYEQRFSFLPSVFAVFLTVFLGLMCISFGTEEENLGRRVRLSVPGRSGVALLATPFLPGGGRGFLFFLLNALLIAVPVLVLPLVFPPSSASEQDEAQLLALTVFLYTLVYVFFPTPFFSRFTRSITYRVAARIVVPVFAMACFLIPTLFGLMVNDRGMQRMQHLGNPGHVIEGVMDFEGFTPSLVILAVIAGMVILLNVPRVASAVAETLTWSARRGAGASSAHRLPEEGIDAVPES